MIHLFAFVCAAIVAVGMIFGVPDAHPAYAIIFVLAYVVALLYAMSMGAAIIYAIRDWRSK